MEIKVWELINSYYNHIIGLFHCKDEAERKIQKYTWFCYENDNPDDISYPKPRRGTGLIYVM